MKVLRHFERLVMAQVVVAICAFCIADSNPPLLVASVGVVLGAWALRRSWPEMGLPKWAVNLASFASVGWLLLELRGDAPQLVTAAGRFVISLQVIVLWGPRGNREYGQLMALSLLLMIAAAVLTVQLAFGVLLAAYCLVALLAVLMLEIKSTGDQVVRDQRAATPAHAARPTADAAVGRGAGAQLRSIAVLVGLACATVAAGTFVALPRSESTLVDLDLRRLTRRPGFADRVRFGSGNLVNDDPTPVMAVRVSLADGTPLGASAGPLLLRGAALDAYRPEDREWVRSPLAAHLDRGVAARHGPTRLGFARDDHLELRAEIALKGVGAGFLFTVMPPTQISGPALDRVQFNPLDFCVSSAAGTAGAMVYEVRWPAIGSPAYEPGAGWLHSFGRATPLGGDARRDDYATGWRVKPNRVRAMAERVLRDAGVAIPEGVAGAAAERVGVVALPWGGASGPRAAAAAAEPPARVVPSAEHLPAVRAIARHLRENYRYTLDAPRTPPDDDPTTHFLFVAREGHCEAFASALAALTRSLGLPTRVVTGYRASEFNPVSGEFVVRRRHAHAWNEVYLGPKLGWRTFDATPPDLVEAHHGPSDAWWKPIRNLYEYVEFRWVRSVVAYDRRTRDAVLAGAADRLERTAMGGETALGKLWRFLRDIPKNWPYHRVSYTLFAIVSLALLVAVAAFTRNFFAHRRRLRSLQLKELPRRGRRRMARRLRFYLVMVEALERHGYRRPAWQCPRTWADQLAFADAERFEPVVRLTERFYEVRFGHREVDAELAEEVRREVARLEPLLSGRRGGVDAKRGELPRDPPAAAPA